MDFKKLPVYTQKDKIIEALKSHNIIIVESPTGSGKTTQLPIILHEAGYTKNGAIGITQPRRIATLAVSQFIAEQLESPLGEFVGYKMRFEDKTSDKTKIKVMTDGTLLQEMKKDKLLLAYQVIMIDEAHERSLNIDFILGLLKTIQRFRRDMKVIISSATLNTKTFSDYFNNAPVVSIKTPTFPVQVYYDPIPVPAPSTEEKLPLHLRPAFTQEGVYIPSSDALAQKVTSLVGMLIENKNQGDILVFLSGEKPIKDTIEKLKLAYPKELLVLPLYGRISQEEQQEVFKKTPKGKIKVVVGTNIMETSITINGVTTVIDSGLVKLNHYDHKNYNSALVEQAISQASAEQRAGRAGRTQPGVCYRLYDQKSFKKRALYTPEEIYRTDLSEVLMHMSELGLTNFESFPFISNPGRLSIQGAKITLKDLDAIQRDNSLSEKGKIMALFPLLPKHSRILVEAMVKYPTSLYNVTQGVAFLSTNSPFLYPQGEEAEAREAQNHWTDKKGDLISYLKILKAFEYSQKKQEFCDKYYLEFKTMEEILNIQKQLSEIIEHQGVAIEKKDNYKDYILAMGSGLIQMIGRRVGKNTYANLTINAFSLHPSSLMFHESPEYIICGEIVKTTRMFARSACALTPSEVETISPSLYRALKSIRVQNPLYKRREKVSSQKSYSEDKGKDNPKNKGGKKPFYSKGTKKFIKNKPKTR